MTLRECLAFGTGSLRERDVPEAENDAWLLLEKAAGVTRSRYFLDPGRPVTAEEEAAYRELIGRRSRRIPLQHLIGETEFMGLPFFVNEDVLIPRPDTETLVEQVLDWAKEQRRVSSEPVRALDLCTGSGCVAVSLARYGHFASVIGSDISGRALAVAEKNACRNGCENISFRKSDLCRAFGEERFQVITANPPYIPTEEMKDLMPEVRDHDPGIALDGGEDGLVFYRRLAGECPRHLTRRGRLFLEIGWNQSEPVSRLLREAGFRRIAVSRDMAGNPRVITGEWTCLTD